METIFISIPSFMDKQLIETIKSARNTANNESRLYFGIANTRTPDGSSLYSSDYDPMLEDKSHISILEVTADRPLGIGMSRLLAQLAEYNFPHVGFDYTLQVDAHMIFEVGWDDMLIQKYKLLEKMFGSKIVISNHCDWWHPRLSDGVPVLRAEVENVIDPGGFRSEDYEARNASSEVTMRADSSGVVRPDSNNLTSFQPKDDLHAWWMEQTFISGHMLFGRHSMLKEFLHDPYIPWDGDRFVYGFRLLSNGYRLFAVDSPVLLHMNSNYRTRVYPDSTEPENQTWRLVQDGVNGINLRMGDYRTEAIVSGRILGFWGSPTADDAARARKIMGPEVNNYYEI